MALIEGFDGSSNKSYSIGVTGITTDPITGKEVGSLMVSIVQNGVTNVKDFGAVGNGTTDDTVAIAAALSSVNSAGGGIVFFPAGTYLTSNQTLYSNVYLLGSGIGATIIKLKNGSNSDLFSAFTGNINLSGVLPGGPTTGVFFWGFASLTLDGNKSNQTGGPSYCIRAYGNGHKLEHVEIRNGYSGNILVDWYGPVDRTGTNDAPMPRWFDVMSHDCNGIGIQVGGPTDMEWVGVNGFATGSHVVHICPNATALRMANCHLWATPIGVSALTLLCEASSLAMTNCQIEGSDFVTLGLLGSDNQLSGCEVGIATDAIRDGVGIQLGQNAGSTPIPGQIFQSAGITLSAASNTNLIIAKEFNCEDGAINEINTVNNLFILSVYQTTGTAIASNGGYPLSSDNGQIIVHGLIPDGSPGKGGFYQMNISSYNGLKVFGQTGDAIFDINTMSKANGGGFAIQNGYVLGLFSDGGITTTNLFQNNANGQIWFGNGFDTYIQKNGAGIVQAGNAVQLSTSGSTLFSGSGAPNNANGSNGDYYFRTDTPAIANQRIYVKSAGAWVGIV